MRTRCAREMVSSKAGGDRRGRLGPQGVERVWHASWQFSELRPGGEKVMGFISALRAVLW